MHRLRSTPRCLTLLLAIGLSASVAAAQPGTLDSSFGDGGVVFLDAATIEGVALQTDGKLVAVGSRPLSGPLDRIGAVWRVNNDGTPDLTFGDGGVTTPGFVEYFFDAVPAPSGDLYAVGAYYSAVDAPGVGVVTRFGSDGTLDPTFGGGGIVEGVDVGVSGSFRNVHLLADGRIVAAGPERRRADSSSCYAARYLPDGSPDPSFGNEGGVVVEPGPLDPDEGTSSDCHAATFDGESRIIFATSTAASGEVVRWAGLRLLTDGSTDPSFEPVSDVTGLGSLYVVASSPDGHVTFGGRNDSFEPMLVRFTSDGTPDASFAEGGVAVLNVSGTIGGVVTQADGKLLLTGSPLFDGPPWVARVLTDGTLDPEFGTGGVVTLESVAPGVGRAVALDTEGRAVVVGSDFGATGFIVRLLNDGAVANAPSVQPERLALSAPAPNPVSGRTSLSYVLADPSAVRLAVYDVLGREVAVTASGTRTAGAHEVTFEASHLAPGLYIVRLTAGGDTRIRRFTVVR